MDLQTYNTDFLNARGNTGRIFPAVQELNTDQVHVWTVSFNQPANLVSDLSEMLSEEEINRANSFRFPAHKNQFIIFHGVLRILLGRYTGINENERILESGGHGKPCIQKRFNHQEIQFSMSKSSDVGIYAFTLKNQIGVDIEEMKPLPEMISIVDRYFSRNEKNIFKRLREEEKKEWFYTIWTRKEAFIKAIGLGFYFPVEEADVSNKGMVYIDKNESGRINPGLSFITDDLDLFPAFKSALCIPQDLQIRD